jgi:3-deoxy-D-manno-octulosonate 8-phosphate phosphatase (KDO 8-P phosphatase)
MKAIGAIAMDVDGVLTDGSFMWGPSGEEYKKFSFTDVMGLSRALKASLHLALISGENSPLIDRFAEKVGILTVVKGCKDKGRALQNFAQRCGTAMQHVAYIGDDINDLPALALAGLGIAPSNAQPEVKAAAHVVTERAGGDGAVREIIEMILAARGLPTP